MISEQPGRQGPLGILILVILAVLFLQPPEAEGKAANNGSRSHGRIISSTLASFSSGDTEGMPVIRGDAAQTDWHDVWEPLRMSIVSPGLLLALLTALAILLLVRIREQRQSLQQAEEHNQRLTCILQGARAGTWEWNVQTGETRFNERWAEIVGYRLEELEPVSIRTWKWLVHPDDLAEANARLQRHFAGKSDHYEMELRLRHKDGHWVWIYDSGRIMTRTSIGKPEWMFGTCLDVSERRAAQEERDEWLTSFAELSSNVPGVICQYRLRPDGSSYFPFASEGLWSIYGCKPEDVADDASPILEVIHPDDRDRIRRSIEESARTLDAWHETYRVNHPELGERRVEGNATPSSQPDGSVIWHSYVRDITDLHRALDRVRTAASVFDASHEGILISDADHAFRDVNRAFEQITGFPRDEVVGNTPETLLPEEERERAAETIHSALETRDQWNGELSIRRKSGETFPAEMHVAAVRDEDGRVSHYVTLLSDISMRKAQEQHLGEMANLDPLTGVGNRRMADERLRHAVARAQQSGTRFAACVMDLDEFKPVNDHYGHEAGDHVLKTIAERVQELIRSEDCLCRLGGDEFLIILREPQGESVFERILETVRVPIRIDIDIVRVSSSLGVTVFDGDDAVEPEDILQRADRALYAAKSAGRNRFSLDSD